MKRHARSIAIILTLLITLAMAGCAGTKKTTEESEAKKATTKVTTTTAEKLPEVSLKYWAYSRWKGINTTDGTGEYCDWQRSLAKTFMEMHPNVKSINVEHLPFDGGPDKVNVAIASNNMPDILEDTNQRSFGYVAKGVQVALDDYFSDEELKDFKPGAWDSQRYSDGKVYGIPWASGLQHALINVSLVKKAGAEDLLPGPDGKYTYDELKELLVAVSPLKNEGIYPTAFYAANEQVDSCTWAFMGGFGEGVRPFNEDYTKVTLGSPNAVRGIEYMIELMDEGLVLPGAESLTSNAVRELFYQQKLVYVFNTHNGVVSTIDAAFESGKFKEFEYQWLRFPTEKKGGEAYAGVGFLNYSVFKSDPVREKWAVELAKFATNTENQKAIKNFSMFPSRISVGNLYEGDAYMTWAADASQYSYSLGFISPAFASFRALFFPEMQAVFTRTKTPQQAMDDFTRLAQKEVDKFK